MWCSSMSIVVNRAPSQFLISRMGMLFSMTRGLFSFVLTPDSPTLSCSLHNVVLRHSIPNTIRGTVSESYPHLIFEGFKSPLGLRIVKILKVRP